MSYNKQIYFWTLNGFGPNGDISLLNMRVFRGKMHKIQNGLQPFPNYKTKVRGRVVQCWGTPWGSLQILSFLFFSKVILCKNSHFFIIILQTPQFFQTCLEALLSYFLHTIKPGSENLCYICFKCTFSPLTLKLRP